MFTFYHWTTVQNDHFNFRNANINNLCGHQGAFDLRLQLRLIGRLDGPLTKAEVTSPRRQRLQLRRVCCAFPALVCVCVVFPASVCVWGVFRR